MEIYAKKAIITLLPEWKPELEQLKKEQFYNGTQDEMLRYIIMRGLDASKQVTNPSQETIT